MTYRQQLRKMISAEIGLRDWATEERLDHMAAKLQQTYPGNYTLEEYFNSNTLSWDYRLKFATQEDEVWFLLQNP